MTSETRNGSGKDRAASGPSELTLRILSAAILLPIVLGATWYGGIAFAVMIVIASAIIFHEWIGLTFPEAPLAMVLAAGAAILVAVALSQVDDTVHALIVLVAAAAIAQGLSLARRPVAWVASGMFYAGFAGIALISLRAGSLGLIAILFVFAVIWGTDIAAYFAGRALGGPKLWPKVSPNKTWSGAIGGLCFGVAAGLLVAHWGDVAIGVPLALAAALLSVAGQLGDLLESAIKRRAGKKDSGTLIPGHGGLMDRVDALVVSAGVAATIGWIRAGFADPATGLLVW